MRITNIEIQKQLNSGVNVPYFEDVDVDLKLLISIPAHVTWLVKGKASNQVFFINAKYKVIQMQNFREMGNLKYRAVKYKYVNIAKK